MNPLPSPETVSAWAYFFRAHRILRDKVEADLKAAKLPPLSWYDVLWLVYDTPQRRQRQSEIGSRLLLPKHNLSRLLHRMADRGLIVKTVCHDDKRGNFIDITPAGKKQLKEMWSVYGAAIQRHFGNQFTRQELHRLQALVARVVSSEKSSSYQSQTPP